jgi:hypothetical protein
VAALSHRNVAVRIAAASGLWYPISKGFKSSSAATALGKIRHAGARLALRGMLRKPKRRLSTFLRMGGEWIR